MLPVLLFLFVFLVIFVDNCFFQDDSGAYKALRPILSIWEAFVAVVPFRDVVSQGIKGEEFAWDRQGVGDAVAGGPSVVSVSAQDNGINGFFQIIV
jgi:hypothetical protein